MISWARYFTQLFGHCIQNGLILSFDHMKDSFTPSVPLQVSNCLYFVSSAESIDFLKGLANALSCLCRIIFHCNSYQWKRCPKNEFASLKLYRVYLDPFNLSDVDDYSWSGVLKDFIQVEIEKGKFVVLCKGLFTWSGGPRSSGVGFFCFHALGDTKQKKPTPLDWGPPLHVNRV